MKRAPTPVQIGSLAAALVALLAAGAWWVAGNPGLPRLWASVANALSGNAFAGPAAAAPDAPASTNAAPAATSTNAAPAATSTNAAPVATNASAASAAASSGGGSAGAALDTELVSQRAPAGNRPANAFAPKSWLVAAPPPPPPPLPVVLPPPAPPPQAPPLPFKYVGVLHVSPDHTLWYLLSGERLIIAATGEVIDNTHRIDGADAGQLRFTYMPLAQRQSLAIGGTP